MENAERDNLRRFVIASRQRGDFGATFLKCDGRSGAYTAGKANMNGAKLLAELPDVMHGWQRLERGQKPIYCIGRVADGFEPPDREALGDNVPGLWADPKQDPWSEVSMSPMLDLENCEHFLFTTTSDGGRNAVAALLDAYLDNLKDHPEDTNKLPIVTLSSDSYTNSNNKKIYFPVFEIDSWDERPSAVRHIKPPPISMLTLEADANPPTKALPAPARARKNARADMDDEIPF
jgi:hypothetical protein